MSDTLAAVTVSGWVQIGGLTADILGVVLVAKYTPHVVAIDGGKWAIESGASWALVGWLLIVFGLLAQMIAVVIGAAS